MSEMKVFLGIGLSVGTPRILCGEFLEILLSKTNGKSLDLGHWLRSRYWMLIWLFCSISWIYYTWDKILLTLDWSVALNNHRRMGKSWQCDHMDMFHWAKMYYIVVFYIHTQHFVSCNVVPESIGYFTKNNILFLIFIFLIWGIGAKWSTILFCQDIVGSLLF